MSFQMLSVKTRAVLSIVSGCCIAVALLTPHDARAAATWTSGLGIIVIPSSGPPPAQVSQSTTNGGLLSGALGSTGPCPGPGCATGTGSVLVAPSPVLRAFESGDTGSQELVQTSFDLQMLGEIIAPVGPAPGPTGFAGVTYLVDGRQTNNDGNSSSLMTGLLNVTSSFSGGGAPSTCSVRLTRGLLNPGSDPVSASCLDIVPVSFVQPNDFNFTQALSIQTFGNASADFLSTALISSLELFDANMHSLGNITMSDGGVQIPGGNVSSVPEPATFALIGLGLSCLGVARRRRTP